MDIYICTAALFIILKNHNTSPVPFNRWIVKEAGIIHNMEYYLVMKGNKVLIHLKLGCISKKLSYMKKPISKVHTLYFYICTILNEK